MKVIANLDCADCLDANKDCGLHPLLKFEPIDATIFQDNKPIVTRKHCGCWVLPCNEHQ